MREKDLSVNQALIPNQPTDSPSHASESASPSVEAVDRVPTTEVAPTTEAVSTADAIAGTWSGEANTSSADVYTIHVDIRQSCKLNEQCGTISVLEVPCYGEISLIAIHPDSYEFDVNNFDDRSSELCTPGAGEHFQLLPDGRLSYRADWGVQGILATRREAPRSNEGERRDDSRAC
jgi:hypothetical protein